MIRYRITADMKDITTADDRSEIARALQLVHHLSTICVAALSSCEADHDRITAVFAMSDEHHAIAFEDIINSLTPFGVERILS